MKGIGESKIYGRMMTALCDNLFAGTDEKLIINVLANRSCAQRQEIKLKFKSMYGRVSGDR